MFRLAQRNIICVRKRFANSKRFHTVPRTNQTSQWPPKIAGISLGWLPLARRAWVRWRDRPPQITLGWRDPKAYRRPSFECQSRRPQSSTWLTTATILEAWTLKRSNKKQRELIKSPNLDTSGSLKTDTFNSFWTPCAMCLFKLFTSGTEVASSYANLSEQEKESTSEKSSTPTG